MLELWWDETSPFADERALRRSMEVLCIGTETRRRPLVQIMNEQAISYALSVGVIIVIQCQEGSACCRPKVEELDSMLSIVLLLLIKLPWQHS